MPKRHSGANNTTLPSKVFLLNVMFREKKKNTTVLECIA
jgi:hypothetical protein